jgi:hypothetical protein
MAEPVQPSCSPNYQQELVDLGPGNSLCFSGKELEVHHPSPHNDSAIMNVVHFPLAYFANGM